MLLKSSRTGGHMRRHTTCEDTATGARSRSNTLPRTRSKGVHHEQPSSLPNNDSLDTLSKDFFLSGLIDKENSIPVLETVKPAFSSSGSRRSSSSALEPIFSLMEISEEEPFTHCTTALTEVTIIVDEIMRMAKQRESNIVNFSRELFTLVCDILVVCSV